MKKVNMIADGYVLGEMKSKMIYPFVVVYKRLAKIIK